MKGQTNELKPCPFCGYEEIVVSPTGFHGAYIAYCIQCHSSTGDYDTKADAIAAWNRRAYDD